jgi:Uma2 family endonuclease
MTTIIPSQTPLTPLGLPASPSDEPLFEIIDGQNVELPPMSAYAVMIANRLVGKLNEFAGPRDLGQAVTEMLFHLQLPVNRNRRPDGAFVSYQRWPKGKPMSLRDNAWDVVPELAIEVVSPNDPADDLMDKIDEYFRSDVKLVWVVFPSTRVVQVYESLTAIQVLTKGDTLDGGNVLPDFRFPLANLFLEETSNA